MPLLRRSDGYDLGMSVHRRRPRKNCRKKSGSFVFAVNAASGTRYCRDPVSPSGDARTASSCRSACSAALRAGPSIARGNPPRRKPQRAPCVASLRARITSSREMMPTSWRSAPITGKLQAFRLTINWRTRVNGAVGSTCTTHFRHRAFHHVIVVRHHLTGGEGECSQKIEFGHDTQHLSFLYDWEGIEIMLLEQRFQISKSDVARHGRDVARHVLACRAFDKSVHRSTGLALCLFGVRLLVRRNHFSILRRRQCENRQQTGLSANRSRVTPPYAHSPSRERP